MEFVSLKDLRKIAEDYNGKLLSTDPRFKRSVTLIHMDGSFFHYSHAFLMQAANEVNRTLKIRVQAGNFEALCRMIESNVGIGLLPEPAARRHVKTSAIRTIPLSDDWALRKLQICARNFKKLPLFAKDLIDMLLADAASNQTNP